MMEKAEQERIQKEKNRSDDFSAKTQQLGLRKNPDLLQDRRDFGTNSSAAEEQAKIDVADDKEDAIDKAEALNIAAGEMGKSAAIIEEKAICYRNVQDIAANNLEINRLVLKDAEEIPMAAQQLVFEKAERAGIAAEQLAKDSITLAKAEQDRLDAEEEAAIIIEKQNHEFSMSTPSSMNIDAPPKTKEQRRNTIRDENNVDFRKPPLLKEMNARPRPCDEITPKINQLVSNASLDLQKSLPPINIGSLEPDEEFKSASLEAEKRLQRKGPEVPEKDAADVIEEDRHTPLRKGTMQIKNRVATIVSATSVDEPAPHQELMTSQEEQERDRGFCRGRCTIL